MRKGLEKAIIAALGVACILMFMLGHYAGTEEAHTLIHTRLMELCPTHEIYHTVSGKHVCHLDAISVRQMD